VSVPLFIRFWKPYYERAIGEKGIP
jgi:hypothetical protein